MGTAWKELEERVSTAVTLAAASGGGGISGCGAGGTGKIRGKRAVRLQFLAGGRGGKIVLHGAGESF